MNLRRSILGVFDLSFTQDRVKWPKMDVCNTFSLTGFILTTGQCRVTATPRFHSILLQLHTLKAQYITVPIKVPRDTFQESFPYMNYSCVSNISAYMRQQGGKS